MSKRKDTIIDSKKFFNMFKKYLRSLPNEALDMIEMYTGGGGYLGNFLRYARSGTPDNIINKKNIPNIRFFNDLILNAPRINVSFWVYRYTDSFYKTSNGPQGPEIFDPGFMSTTLDLESLQKLGWGDAKNSKLSKFLIPAGAPFLYLGPLSQVPEEEEVLLPIGSRFVELERNGNMRTYQFISCRNCDECSNDFSCLDSLSEEYRIEISKRPSKIELARSLLEIDNIPLYVKKFNKQKSGPLKTMWKQKIDNKP